jgi:hypothetical protein
MTRTEGTVVTEELKDITLALSNDRLNWADQMGMEKLVQTVRWTAQWVNVELVGIESTMLLSATYMSKDGRHEKFDNQ